jgi:multimeric flavodoxin WrbA
MKVVAFNGSPHKDGNTACLINHVFAALNKEGIETEMVQVGGYLVHGCMACRRCFEAKNGRCAQSDDVINGCIDKMRTADGVILASPTYFADITPEMKALIDRGGFVARASGNFPGAWATMAWHRPADSSRARAATSCAAKSARPSSSPAAAEKSTPSTR